jgi:hypothetical protein
MQRQLLVLAAVLLAPLPSAQGQQLPPGCSGMEHRQFDFWLGDWTVTDSAGRATLGTNLVTQEEGGCLIHEHWHGSRGGTGQSFNFYDPSQRQWEQVWVASGGGVLRLLGHLEGTSMILEGDSASPTGVSMRNRVAWIPQTDGRVRQYWRTSTDGGKTWQVSFDGWYRKA